MRLFHVSEQADIAAFAPRLPSRADLPPDVGLVWAISEDCLPNFLTPRNCPRVAYHVCAQTTERDRARFFSSPTQTHAVVLEGRWLEALRATTLYLYEFAPADFELQDAVAGYYVAKTTQYPIRRLVLDDLLQALTARNVELRLVDSLWPIAEAVKASSLNWSLCRMAFA